MDFLKFTIINEKADQQIGTEEQIILINKNHIVSIKPINIMIAEGEVVKGFWIRNSNGKKYKATKVPKEIEEALSSMNTVINANSGLSERPTLN